MLCFHSLIRGAQVQLTWSRQDLPSLSQEPNGCQVSMSQSQQQSLPALLSLQHIWVQHSPVMLSSTFGLSTAL